MPPVAARRRRWEKLSLALMVALGWYDPALAGMPVPAIFDALCVLIYSAFLLQEEKEAPPDPLDRR
jgi:hypothetical protein